MIRYDMMTHPVGCDPARFKIQMHPIFTRFIRRKFAAYAMPLNKAIAIVNAPHTITLDRKGKILTNFFCSWLPATGRAFFRALKTLTNDFIDYE